MHKFFTFGVMTLGLLLVALPASAAKTCNDDITPKSSGCPLDFPEKLVAFDSFNDGLDGWSGWALSNPICGGDPMLVLTPNPGVSASKNYNTLPEHNFVRIQATAYFVDDWIGETAVLLLDGNIVWTDQHDQRNIRGTPDVCGDPIYSEGKLGVPIDITIPHVAVSLNVSARTTLSKGVIAALALDDVRISVFSYAP